jgi:membrane-associated phospholipid phosphatase
LGTKILNFLLAQGIVTILYYAAFYFTPFKPIELPITFIDRNIGFHKVFAYIYISFFIMLLISIISVEKSNSYRCAISIVINALIASFIFFFFPTSMPHIYYSDEEHTSYFLSKFILAVDINYNCFPSIHISNALTASYFLALNRRLFLKCIIWFWFLLITWSVISTKQHYFYDILGGIILSMISLYVVNKFIHYNKKPLTN